MLGPVPAAPGTAAHRSARARFARGISIVTALAVSMLGAVVMAPAAQAAGAMTFDAALSSPLTALQGGTFTATFTANNPAGSSTPAYNTGYRIVLPAGISVDPAVQPRWTSTATDGTTGVTTVFWSNLSDLLAGSSGTAGPEVSFAVPLKAATTVALGPKTISGGVYVNTDPRTLPTFDASGVGTGATTAYQLVSTTTTLVPFTLTKSLVGWDENELLRGVHEHRARVDLKIDNNKVQSSTSFSIVDYIPAELEFLGCGATGADGNPDVNGDNSPSGFFEAGTSERLNATDFGLAAGTCPLPSSVDTKIFTTDPDGSGPVTVGKVYTVVTWDNAALRTAAATTLAGDGALGAGETATISYVMGIPQNPNVAFPPGTSTGGVQASNLSNNPTTSTTREATTSSTAETSVTNAATLSGSYDDPNTVGGAVTYTDEGQSTLTLEDVALVKTASTGAIVQGRDTLWTLTVRVSEYTTASTGIVLTDVLPDGLEPQVSGTAPAWAGAPVYNADGTVRITWNLQPMADGGLKRQEVTLATKALNAYRVPASPAEPVRAQDSWKNTATLTSTTTDLDGTVRTVDDASQASQTAAPVELFKQVAQPGTGATAVARCQAASWPTDLTASQAAGDFGFTPGDLVCWRLTVKTPVGLDTTGLLLSDFLPAGFTFDAAAKTPASDVDIASTSPASPTTSIDWTFTNGGDLAKNSLAQIVVASHITDATAKANADVVGNLAKLRYSNTLGEDFQLRKQADVTWLEPILALTKTAVGVSGANTASLHGGDQVDYTVTVTNTGGIAADHVAVRDVLPSQLTCTDLVSITTPGFTCAGSPAVLSGTLSTVAASGGTATLQYRVRIPVSLTPGTVLTNVAHVDSYDVATNDPANPTFPYTSTLSAPRSVTVDAVTMQKTVDSSVNDRGEQHDRPGDPRGDPHLHGDDAAPRRYDPHLWPGRRPAEQQPGPRPRVGRAHDGQHDRWRLVDLPVRSDRDGPAPGLSGGLHGRQRRPVPRLHGAGRLPDLLRPRRRQHAAERGDHLRDGDDERHRLGDDADRRAQPRRDEDRRRPGSRRDAR